MKAKYIVCLLCSALIFACVSPTKHFEKGNYKKAYSSLLKEFEKGDHNRKDKTLLNKSFKAMLSNYNTNANIAFRSADLNDWEDIYYEADELILDYLKGERWLDSDISGDMRSVELEKDSLRMDLAEAYKQLGDELMHEYDLKGDKRLAQDAHKYYQDLDKFDDGQFAINDLLDSSLEAGTIHVLVEADAWDYGHKWKVDDRFRYIENHSRKFREIYFEDIVDVVDCRLMIEFSRLDIDETEESTTDNYSKEIVDHYESYVDSAGVKHEKAIYRTVQASVKCETIFTNYEWEARAEVDLLLNYCDFHSAQFEAEYQTEAKYYTVKGDERALPDSMKDLKDLEEDISKNKIIKKLIDDVYDQVCRHYF